MRVPVYLLSLTAHLWGVSAQYGSKPLTARTHNGDIIGHTAKLEAGVTEFLGIPYAEPPLGQLRFAPPEKYKGNGRYVAANWGADCPQTGSPPVDFPGFTSQAQRVLNYFAATAGTPQSEDCLTLNVWTRQTEKYNGKAKPVFVFFHGGRFAIGNTDTPFYNGQHLAASQDIVVVTVTYRLNVFGFPGIPGQPQNLGLRDQRIAVEWVRDNIGAFGGDCEKITIAGQSSGGVAVDWWSYAYRDNPIAHGLIATSGTAFSFPVNAPVNVTKNWNTLVGSVSCNSTSNPAEQLSCMRKVPVDTLKAAVAKIKPTPGGSPVRSTPPFYPSIDDLLVFPAQSYLTRPFSPLPILLGNNNNEQGYYVIPAFANGINVTAAQAAQFLLESFTCATSLSASLRLKQNVPVYRYRYFGDWDNTRLYPTSGAYHGTELQMVFGGSAEVSGLPTSQPQREVTRLVQRAWAAFCDNPASGLETTVGWPRYEVGKKSVAEIAYQNAPRIEFVTPGLFDQLCGAITVGALSGLVKS